MDFRIADTFTGSLARLTGDEQKAVKTTAFDLQLNPANPGLQFHKLDQGKDRNFWSVRVGSDLRVIVHKTSGSLLLCYVDHHDRAYDWAERRKLEVHPKTGAAQLVVIRETVREITVPKYVDEETPRAKPAARRLFAGIPDEELLGFGVPPEWLADVKSATDDNYFSIAELLPAEAAEALLELATGGKPQAARPTDADPFEHPDAQRRFRVMANVEELQRALDEPWEKWTIFLHPAQREIARKRYNGPARVSGSAGTGKTIVALHRAVHLARAHPDSRVLLATFSEPLAHALHTKLKRLLGNEPRLGDRIDVTSLEALGLRLHQALVGKVTLASRAQIAAAVREAGHQVGDHRFALPFLLTEWDQVVDGWQLLSWEAYRDVARLGRKTRLSDPQRRTLWSIFEIVRQRLAEQNLTTNAALFAALATALENPKNRPYDFAVIDESQDLGIAQLRFFVALGANREDALFFCRRPRAANLPAAVFVEESRRGHPRPFENAAGQLSHQSPDSHARRSAARSRSCRRGRHHGEAERDDFGVQWSRAADPGLRNGT
jgi:mRNA-degrading endonuclease RelE of RelBE toxin-antitoxin system